ncbi:MAG TPA: cytochrome P450 [Acetobacteraceae bacterium]|nr:cytochrome P450 [Acetobacteraceae bacterium]
MDAVIELARPPARLAGQLCRPPAPEPQPAPLGLFRLLRVLKSNPIECWADEHFEQPVSIASRLLGHVVLLNEPTAIRRVLLDHASNYRKDSLQRRVLSAGLGYGLLSAEGEQWQEQRRILAPMFSHRMVGCFTPAIMQAAAALVARWHALSAQESQVDVAAEMTRLTLDVLVRTIFSDGLGCDSEQLRSAMSTYFEVIGRIDPLDLLGAPDFIPRFGRWRARPAMRFFDAAIDKIIATRRHRLARDPDDVPQDLLTLLLNALDPDTGRRMTEAEVRSNILTFIAAGHETTANCLSWSLYLLSRSPDWNERVAAEAVRETDSPISEMADRLVLTRAVIDESLRLYPPIAAISRVAKGPDELAGVAIKRGSMVVIAPWVLHRHRRLWRDPDHFDPNRFLGGARAGIDRFAWLPFGAGMRTCIGATFALREATLVLATIMKHFSLVPVHGHAVWPLLRVTLRPGNGLPMTVTPRHCN